MKNSLASDRVAPDRVASPDQLPPPDQAISPYRVSVSDPFFASARFLFAIPWFVVGCQHFMYAGFVRDIIPAYIPFRMFWVYFTAISMMAACVSFVTGILSALAARLLGCMMVIFLLLIHTSILSGDPHAINWTRFFQDLSITGAAFILGSVGWRGGSQWLALAGRYLYAIPLIFLGAQHFWRVAFVTAKIPDYLPLKTVWDYLVGAFIILAALAIVLRQKARQAAMALGTVLLLLGLLYHIPVLIANPYVATAWTAAMLDAMIAAGALMLASSQQVTG